MRVLEESRESVSRSKEGICTLSESALAGMTTLVIATFSNWRDGARLNFLSSIRPGAKWCVLIDGAVAGEGYGPRAAIDSAVLKLEGGAS